MRTRRIAAILALLVLAQGCGTVRLQRDYAELEAIQNRLVRLNNDTIARGAQPLFTSTGINTDTGQVTVALGAPNAELEARLRAQFGDAIYVMIERPAQAPICLFEGTKVENPQTCAD